MLAPDDPMLVEVRHDIQVLSIFATLCEQEEWADALARLDALTISLENIEAMIRARAGS